MTFRTTLTVASLLLISALSCMVSAAEAPVGPQAEIESLRTQLEQLQAAMAQADRQHEEEVKKLAERIRALEGTQTSPGEAQDLEAEALRKLAAQEAEKEGSAEQEEQKQTIFEALGLNLQDLNPEISVTGDMVGLYRSRRDARGRSDFDFRGLGIHIESYLDPYTKFKAAVPVTDSGAELGEAYMTRFSILEGLNITAGKFRQQFGVVNRWHEHALDQVEFPLALTEIFGPGGLNQTGISFDWSMPSLFGASQNLIVQATNGENSRLFSGNLLSVPSVLARYNNYRDLSEDIYLDVGLTALVGWNDEWDVGGETIHKSLSTRVYGTDMSLVWEPADNMRYRNMEWRSEVYVLDRDIYAPDATGRDSMLSWGFYSYVQTLFERVWIAGVRFDYYKPDHKNYAAAGLEPLADTDTNAYRWQIGPYLTWQQSPFVHVRLEYDHSDGCGMDRPADAVMLQLIFAAGPHKHERY